jgi:putative transposase
MKRTIRTEEQIIGNQHEHEAGAKCADLCRKHGTSEGTFDAWKEKLKWLRAEQMLDMAVQKDLLSKKW